MVRVVVKASRVQWRAMEALAARCPAVSRFTREACEAHGAFVGVSRDSQKSSCGMDANEAHAILSAARAAAVELSKRPRYLENTRFVALRDVSCVLSAALDSAGFVEA